MGRYATALVVALGWVLTVAPSTAQDLATVDAPWTLQALEYAHSESVQESRLVRGAPRSSRVDMSWYFFVARRGDKVVLIDAGTDALSRPGRERLRARWSVVRAVPVVEALARIELEPNQVTDIVLTHHHWDHVDGLINFPRATVHAQRGEWSRVPLRLRRAVESSHRVRLIEDESTNLFMGLRVEIGGAHTESQSMVRVACRDRAVWLVSDSAYLYRSIEEGVPSSVTVDRRRSLQDVAQRVEAVGAENVVPGHDAAIFERFPSATSGVANICR